MKECYEELLNAPIDEMVRKKRKGYKKLVTVESLNKYYVTYYYCATGMEGIADTKSYGIVRAENSKKAVNIIIDKVMPLPKHSKSARAFLRGCLTAERSE